MNKKEIYSCYFSLITYLDIDIILDIIKNHTDICDYAYILHDKDIYSDTGELKEKHIHLLLHLSRSNRLNTVRNWFNYVVNGQSINTLAQPIKDITAVLDYLTHVNDIDKYQYEEKNIITNNLDFWKNATVKTDNCLAIVNDLLKKVSIYDLVKRYGKDFIYHYSSYKTIVDLIRYETDPIYNGTFTEVVDYADIPDFEQLKINI